MATFGLRRGRGSDSRDQTIDPWRGTDKARGTQWETDIGSLATLNNVHIAQI